MITPILRQDFYHDGRGPELQKVHYAGRGQVISAVDYFNPDDVYAAENLKHLIFIRPQVFMFTPEEVYSHRRDKVDWSKFDRAGIVCLGKSAWLRSFNQQHLSKCDHYQVMFYDEYLDIICEGVGARTGGYSE
jgi:hypothetical protein